MVYALESPRTIKPWQCIARRQLAPAHGDVAVEGEQAWRWTALYQFTKRCLICIAGLLAIAVADSPIHAPAAVDRPMLTEEVFERRPEIGCEGVVWLASLLTPCAL
jgi:hypothetical protein